MIKLYMDWNVMSQMKNGLHPQLLAIVSNKEKFFNVFSTSHIGDIYASYNSDESRMTIINEDLNYISMLTSNFCAYNNGENVVIEPYAPESLFNQKKEEKDLLQEFSFDNMFKDMGDDNDELTNITSTFKDVLKALPIDSIFKEAYADPIKREQMKTFLPGLEDNLTFEGLINSMMTMFKRLNEQGDYKELRSTIQTGLNINRDRIFNNDDPYKLIEDAYSKMGAVPASNAENHKYAPLWFNQITDNYLALDMHGYQEDKVNVDKGRKETFRNTTEDAFHAAFGSMCDFYITNDKKSYKKSLEVYKKLNLNTIVCNANEFLEHFENYLVRKSIHDDVNIFINLLAKGEYELYEDDACLTRSYYFPFFLFNHFTRAHIHTDKASQQTFIYLSKDSPTNNKWTFRVEIESLVTILTNIFGEDIEQMGALGHNEELDDAWVGRRWKYLDWIFRLTWRNGWLQLYLDSI
jgi:hypothetical protein